MKALSIRQPWDDGFGYWLSGFIDGEGCFFFHDQAGSFSKPHFQLKLRDDDRSILEECATKTGLGYIRSNPRSDASKPQANWIIHKREDCLNLLVILERYPLRAKKARDLSIWKEAVFLWADKKKKGKGKGGGRGTIGYKITEEMRHLKIKLQAMRAYK